MIGWIAGGTIIIIIILVIVLIKLNKPKTLRTKSSSKVINFLKKCCTHRK